MVSPSHFTHKYYHTSLKLVLIWIYVAIVNVVMFQHIVFNVIFFIVDVLFNHVMLHTKLTIFLGVRIFFRLIMFVD